MTRYARQTCLPEVGEAGQARMAASRILIVGAGGLAAPALPLLAGAGVGHLTIVDPDRVDLSNLHRQTLFCERDIGQSKAELAASRCRELNGDICLTGLNQALTPANAGELVSGCDLVMDCADSYAASYTLSDACLRAQVPLISASVLAMGGYAGGFCGGAPSLRAVFPEAPASAATCANAGVLGPVVAVLGAMQAQMALAVLLKLDPSPLGRVVQFDGATLRSNSFCFADAPEPERRFSFTAPGQLTDADLIVDLRSRDEAPEPIHPRALRSLPPDWATASGKGRLALCCGSGLRAWRMAETLQGTWPGEIVLVAAATS